MTDLIRYTPPGQDEWGQLVQLSEMIAPAPFVPDALRGKPGAVMGCMLMGRELGIGPMQSLNDIAFIKGRRTLAATLMASLVRGRGHKFRTIESDDTHAVVQIHRKGEPGPEPAVEFTWADAERAKLAGSDSYQKYPTAMLWSRATSAACRRDASECLGGNAYTPEEIDSIEQDPGSTTAMWGEPEQESGEVGERGVVRPGLEKASGEGTSDSATIQAGPGGGRSRGVRNTSQASAATTSEPGRFPGPGSDRTSGSVAVGANPGPDQTPEPSASAPPGHEGGSGLNAAPQQGDRTGSSAAGAAANTSVLAEVCKTLGLTGEQAAQRLREGGWTLPRAWWKTVEGWTHDDLAEAIAYLEQGAEPPAEVKAS